MPKPSEIHDTPSIGAPGGTTPPAKSSVKAKDREKDKAKDKGKGTGHDGPAGRTAPETVNGNTRVNVAFPFSKIEVQEPSAELVELAGLLCELLGALGDWVPEETLADIRSRAESLRTRLTG